MTPEIRRYLDEHADTYTFEATRRALIDAGHDPAEVNAALQEWEAERIARAATHGERRSFDRWALWLHVGALVAMVVIVVLLNGVESFGIALIGAGVLALALIVGWLLTRLIGRALLPRTGLMVALIFPLISALALGGTCLAIMDGMIPTPPTPGVVELRIDPPLDFQGSGDANCYIQPDATGFNISAEALGTLDGRAVSVSLYSFAPHGDPNAPAPAPAPGAGGELGLYIGLNSTSGSEPSAAYTNIFSTSLEVEQSADGLSGTVTFEGLAPQPLEGPASEPTDGEPISGTVTWTCEEA